LVDAAIDRQSYRGNGMSVLTGVVASRSADDREWQWRPADLSLATFSAFTNDVIDFNQRPPPLPPPFRPQVPLHPLQALKSNISDVLHQHAPLYVIGKAAFPTVRFVLRPLRRGYRALSVVFTH